MDQCQRPHDGAFVVFTRLFSFPVYPGSGIYDKTHIQISIRNPNCIKGFFIPRDEYLPKAPPDNYYPSVDHNATTFKQYYE